jgi:hypothetical protein
VPSVDLEFCCDRDNNSDCEEEYDWWMEEAQLDIYKVDEKADAEALSETAAELVNWVIIVVCAVCCPICIVYAICVCVVKKRDAKVAA